MLTSSYIFILAIPKLSDKESLPRSTCLLKGYYIDHSNIYYSNMNNGMAIFHSWIFIINYFANVHNLDYEFEFRDIRYSNIYYSNMNHGMAILNNQDTFITKGLHKGISNITKDLTRASCQLK